MSEPTSNTDGKKSAKSKVKGPRIVPMRITPQQAREWLAVSPERNQRTLKQRNINKLLHAIETGDWKMTHQPIALDPTGYVLDGRHRLTAIASQRKHVASLVAFDADPDTFGVIDTGAVRSPGDSLKIAGYTDVNVLAATTRQVLAYPEVVNTSTRLSQPAWAMTTVDILEALDDPEIGKVVQESIRSGYMIAKEFGRYGMRTSSTVLIAVIAIHSEKGPSAQEEFLDRVVDGVNLEAGSPILAFRKWLISDAYYKTSPAWRPTIFLANGIKSWNDYVTQTDRFQLRFRPGTDYMPEVL
jgi:hypothetical protein